MIPSSGSQRLARSDPTCLETVRPMHQHGVTRASRAKAEIHLYPNSFHDNVLRRPTRRGRRARIVHSGQLRVRGRRENRPTNTEEL